MPEQKKWVWKTPAWVPGHIERYLTDPEGAHLWDASGAGLDAKLPTLLLTTKGRRSGEPRHSPLLYQPEGSSFVVVASKGGYPDDPGWLLNLMAAKEAEIRVGARTLQVRPRIAHGQERAALWAKMAAFYPPYDDYQQRAKSREIPVVVLEPIG